MGFSDRTAQRGLLVVISAALIVGCGSDETRPQLTCVVAAESLDFGAIPVGGSRTRTLIVHNHGDEEIELAPVVSDSVFILASADSSTWGLAPGDSLDLSLRYSPKSEGVHRGYLELGEEACPTNPEGI